MEHARPPPELNMEGGPVTRADAWKRWKQQFLLFVKASGVSSESAGVQASLLVNLIGPEGFDVFQTFTFDAESEKDDVKVIIKKFDEYFGAKVNTTLLRYKFFTRHQEEGESIQAYVTALRLLSKTCNFGNLEDDLLKDRIVCGVRNVTVRDRLLRCDDLNLDKAIKLCQAEEVSKEGGIQLNIAGESSSSVQVNAIERRAGGRPRAAWRGGGVGGADSARRNHGGGGGDGDGHAGPARRRCAGCGGMRCANGECPAQHVTCFCCGNQGHFVRMCKSRFINEENEVKRVYEIEKSGLCDSDSDDLESFYIDTVLCLEGRRKRWMETLLCEHGSETFLLDSGADYSVLSFDKFISLGFDENMLKLPKENFESFTHNEIPIKGLCYLKWWYNGQCYSLPFAITDMKVQSVLGRDTCENMGLVKRVNTIKLDEYSDMFKGFGCLPDKLIGRFKCNQRHLIKCENSSYVSTLTSAPSAFSDSLSADADDEFKDACEHVGQQQKCDTEPNAVINKVDLLSL